MMMTIRTVLWACRCPRFAACWFVTGEPFGSVGKP